MNHITAKITHTYSTKSFNAMQFNNKLTQLMHRLQKLYIQKNHNQKALEYYGESENSEFLDITNNKIIQIETLLATIEDMVDNGISK